MQAVASLFNTNRLVRVLPFLGAALLVAGIVVFLVNRGNDVAAQDRANNIAAAKSYKAPPKLKTTPLSREVRLVAGKFILDNVQRKNLAEGYSLVAPSMRAGMTKKEWLKGDIPVIPFTVPLATAPLKVDLSRPRHALLEVALIAKSGKKQDGGFFFLELKKFGTGSKAKWLVTSWVPRYAPPIPTNPAGS
jgi:hypothetical protein